MNKYNNRNDEVADLFRQLEELFYASSHCSACKSTACLQQAALQQNVVAGWIVSHSKTKANGTA